MKVWRTWAGDGLPSIRIHVVVGAKRARRAAKGLGLDIDPATSAGADAAVTHTPGSPDVLVSVTKGAARLPDDELMPVLAHEAWHCAVAWMELLGEEERPSEVTAYMIQACLSAIIDGVRAERRRMS